MLWNFKYPEADNRQTLRRKGHSICYRNGMLTHTIHETERHCADYTVSLGIVCTQANIDNSLMWKCQIENIKGKVSRAIGLLKYCKNFISMKTLNDIYRSIVEPHFNYCCSVWSLYKSYKTGLLVLLRVVLMMHLLCHYAKNLAGCPSNK